MILNVGRILLLQPMRQSLPPHMQLEERHAEIVFHLRAIFLFLHDVERPEGFLPHFLMHGSEYAIAFPPLAAKCRAEGKPEETECVGDTRRHFPW